uniref:Variant surface glycoprotein n=1 Tax=Trypanosoma brucei TaxID=5691 RepID=A0A1V0FZ56_9TRYP|nr:variant surface glycoprotein [Trypanosoma brucei]
MSTPLTLLAGILWIFLITQKASSAGPNKGENREVFDFLCRAILASEATPLNPLPAQEAKEAAARATSIELVIKMHSEISKIAEAATTAPSEASPAATDNFPPKCKGENETKCREAAAFLKSLPAADKVLLSEAAAAKAGTKDKLLYTLRKMTKIHTSPPGFGKPGTKLQEIQAELIQAVYGKPTKETPAKLLGNGGDRESHCGKCESEAGASATLSIAATIACLCSSDGGSGTSNTGCYKTATANQAFTAANEDIVGWNTMVTACKEQTPAPTAADKLNLRALATALEEHLYKPKGNDGKIGYIGQVNKGSGATDCNGQDTGGKGACAVFTTGPNTIDMPQWLTKLRQAAEKQEGANTERRQVLLAEAQIAALNESLTTLLHMASTNSERKKDSQDPKPIKTDSSNKKDHCNNIDDATQCEKKSKIAAMKRNKTEVKKCKYNETKAEKSGVPATQAQTGGTETTTDKCKDKKKDDCKSPDCKWEGETCKDYSSLVNKKFL